MSTRPPIKEVTVPGAADVDVTKAVQDLKNDGYAVVFMVNRGGAVFIRAKNMQPELRKGLTLEDS